MERAASRSQPRIKDGDRTNAAMCHLASLAAFFIPFGGLIGPWIVWLATRKDSRFVDAHGRASLNFQLTVAIVDGALILVLLGMMFQWFGGTLATGAVAQGEPSDLVRRSLTVGAILLAVTVLATLLAIVGALRAWSGRSFRYPLAIPFLSRPEQVLGSDA